MSAYARRWLRRFARWTIATVCSLVLLAAIAQVLTGLSHTLAVAGGWSAAPDFVSRIEQGLRFRVHSSLPDQPGMPRFYWRGMRDMLLRPWHTRRGAFHLDLTGGRRVDHFVMDPVPNPYGGHVPTGEVGSVFFWPTGTELLLLDSRCVLAFDDNNRLSARAPQRWSQTSGAVPLVELSQRRPLLYLVTAPLSQYNTARRLLRRAPAGPVLSAATQWDLPATDAELVAAVKEVRKHFHTLLVTADAHLAGYAAKADLDVICVGAEPVGVGRGPAVFLDSWAALLDRLMPSQR